MQHKNLRTVVNFPFHKTKKKNQIITYMCVIKNFVCFSEASVLTVPFATSKPRSFNAFICTTTDKLHVNLNLWWILYTSRCQWDLDKVWIDNLTVSISAPRRSPKLTWTMVASRSESWSISTIGTGTASVSN